MFHAELKLFPTYFKANRSVLGEALLRSFHRSIFTMTLQPLAANWLLVRKS